jgi:hypothetical protein
MEARELAKCFALLELVFILAPTAVATPPIVYAPTALPLRLLCLWRC